MLKAIICWNLVYLYFILFVSKWCSSYITKIFNRTSSKPEIYFGYLYLYTPDDACKPIKSLN